MDLRQSKPWPPLGAVGDTPKWIAPERSALQGAPSYRYRGFTSE